MISKMGHRVSSGQKKRVNFRPAIRSAGRASCHRTISLESCRRRTQSSNCVVICQKPLPKSHYAVSATVCHTSGHSHSILLPSAVARISLAYASHGIVKEIFFLLEFHRHGYSQRTSHDNGLRKAAAFGQLSCLSAAALRQTCGVLYEVGQTLAKTEAPETVPCCSLCSAIT